MENKKVCTGCGQEYPATLEFFAAGKHEGQLIARCRVCRKTYQIECEQENDIVYQEVVNDYLKYLFIDLQRQCNDPSHFNYHRFGAKGIRFEFKDFEEFRNHIVNDLKAADPRGLQVHRIGINGSFKKDNIRIIEKFRWCNEPEYIYRNM